MFIVISIDVETPQSPWAKGLICENKMELLYKGKHFGTSFIIDTLNELNIKGVFFVNPYEAISWGESPLVNICNKIVSFEHEVGLHTHPAWMFDKARHHMWQYSLEEQINIIKQGKEMLCKWIPDFKLISHRAGAYGLNADTVLALSKCDIPLDSSMFYNQSNCKETWMKNRVVKRNNLLEIPITGFWRKKCFLLADILLWTQKKVFIKTDIDWASIDELKAFIRLGEKHGIRIMNFFMHSYSFVRFNRRYNHFEPDYQKILKLKDFLLIIKNSNNFRNVTMSHLLKLYNNKPNQLIDEYDYVPEMRTKKSLYKVIKNKFQ